jgi:hypothetical protein
MFYSVLGYFSAIIVGFLLSVLGAGGSILAVPIFVYLFKFSPKNAVIQSFLVVALTSSYGAWLAYKEKRLEVNNALKFLIGSLVGVFLTRKFIVPLIKDEKVIMISFSVIMILASFSMIKGITIKKALPSFLLIPFAFLIGVITAFVGAGGGFLIVPALCVFLCQDIKKASGTSLFIVTVNSIFGFFVSAFTNDFKIEWAILFVFLVFTILGVQIGNKLIHKINSNTLKVFFGYFILIFGFLILIFK